MKTKQVLLALFLLSASISFAQIPNASFENWEDQGNYQEPAGWKTANIFIPGGNVYPVSKSTDHYPGATGSYSIKIQNNPTMGAYGIATTTSDLMAGPLPAFPVQGHPSTLRLYYKYAPQSGDSMYIAILLYSKGAVVSTAEYLSGSTTSTWTVLNLSLPKYDNADSASILMAAYKADGPPPAYTPKGNSVLYVDNMSLIESQTAIAPKTKTKSICYPNPVMDVLHLTVANIKTISVFDNMGQLVEKVSNPGTQLNMHSLNPGHYTIMLNDQQSECYRIIKE